MYHKKVEYSTYASMYYMGWVVKTQLSMLEFYIIKIIKNFLN